MPLSFTDGASLPDGSMVFTAVAEDTEDTYNDGACLGAAIGVAARDGTLRLLERLDECHKVEGVAARVDDDVIRLLLVTDADDPAIPASLFSATLPNSQQLTSYSVLSHEPMRRPHAQNERDGVISPTRSPTTQPPTTRNDSEAPWDHQYWSESPWH